MSFDIRDGCNRYAPCPNCGATTGMGIVSMRGGFGPITAVRCVSYCDFTGPGIPGLSDDTDRLSFEAWNALPRRAALAEEAVR